MVTFATAVSARSTTACRADDDDVGGVGDLPDAVHRRRCAVEEHLGPVEQRERAGHGAEHRLDLATAPLEGGQDVTGTGHGQAHAAFLPAGPVTYRAAATDSSVPASFCEIQIGTTEKTMSAAATTLTTGAWLGRNRFW